MPVLLSSLIDVPAGELAGVLAADESRCCLREWLARVPDPRSRLGRWHPLEYVLALAICAFTAAGHDSPAAVAEWAAGCSQDTLAVLGGRRDPWARQIRPPSVRTFSRVFGRIDAEAFNAALYGYLAAVPASPAGALPAVTVHEREQRRAARRQARPAAAAAAGRRGRQDRPRRGPPRRQPGPPAVRLRRGHRVRARPAGDRRQDQRDPRTGPRHRAPGPHRAGGHRGRPAHPGRNRPPPGRGQARPLPDDHQGQPALPAAGAAKALAGPDAGFADATWAEEGKGHGRRERRSIRTAPADGITWPHAAQVMRIRRDTGPTRGPWTHKEIAYGITSLPADLAGPRHLAIYARHHWAIENREHYVRDKTFGEDLQRVRTGNQPNAYAAIRNLVTGAFRRTGFANIAHARRYYGRDDQRILALYGYA